MEESTVGEDQEAGDTASGEAGLNFGARVDDGGEVRRRSEVEALKKLLIEKEEAYTTLEKQFNEINAELAVKEEGLQELREQVQRALEMCENGAEYQYLDEALRKVLDTIR